VDNPKRGLPNPSLRRRLFGRLRRIQMLHLLVVLSSIHHLHAIVACVGAFDVIGFTILYVEFGSDMVAMRKARTCL
jgi:hypothetical protein